MPRRVRIAAAGLCAALAAGAGCASRGFVPPQGPGRTLADPAEVWTDVAARCAALEAVQAQVRLSGRVGATRLPGLLVGLVATRREEIGLEARVSGSVVFVLGGRTGSAVLVLPRDRRVVTAAPADILDALVGVAWEPSRLMAVVAGCPAPGAVVQSAADYADGVAAVRFSTGDVAFLARAGGRRTVRAARTGGLEVDYQTGADGWPTDVRIGSEPGRTPAVALHLKVEAMVRNPTVAPATFTVAVPAGAEAMSVQQLRDGGPLGDALPRP